MASIVDTSVKYFQSTLANAPVLNGKTGSLIGLLDALLVNGYGLQTATSVVVADGIATCTFPSPFPVLVDQVVLVAGATPTVLNGEQKVVSVGDKIVRFATTAANGTASGAISVKMAPAGWAKVFSGTNKAVYRSTDPQAHAGGMFLRVDDSPTQAARVIGFETMSDVDTGTGPFPTAAQISGGGYWPKGVDGGATPVSWFFAADSRFFFFSCIPYSVYGANFRATITKGFGDFVSRRPSGDAFAVALNSAFDGSVGNQHDGGFDVARGTPRTAFARAFIGLGSSQMHVVAPYTGNGGATSGADTTLGGFPNPVTGELLLSKCFATVNGAPRADLPGMVSVPQSGAGDNLSVFDRVVGSGDLAGRTLVVLNPTPQVNATSGFGCSLIDVTGPWR